MVDDQTVDVVFLQPSGYGSGGFPMGIAILSQILINAGIKVSVVDASSEKLALATTVDRILSENPRILAATGMAHNSLFIKKVSREIRRSRPEIIQIAGGAWVVSVEEFVLKNVDLDYVVTGEADEIILQLVETLLKGDEIPDLPGLSYLKDGEFIKIVPGRRITTGKIGPGRGFMFVPKTTFQEVPFPAYDLFNMDHYTLTTTPDKLFWFSAILPQLRKKGEHRQELKVGSILSGRGCFGKCDFCGAAETARRTSTPDYVVDNMEYMNQKFGTNTFLFMESLTFAAPKWVKAFCEELIARNSNFYWVAISRGDFRYDEEHLRLLQQSGCIAINIGFESGSNDMLAKMHKEVTVEQYYKIYDDFTAQNILVFGQYVTNMPGETIESLTETAEFVERTQMLFSFGAAHPYADTKLFDWAKENKFCDVEDVMFTTENKGKTSRQEVAEYIDRWNFNHFEFESFYRQWKRLNRIKLRNILIHKNRYIVLFVLNHVPLFLYDLAVKLSVRNYITIAREAIKTRGLVHGGSYLLRKLTSRIALAQGRAHGRDRSRRPSPASPSRS